MEEKKQEENSKALKDVYYDVSSPGSLSTWQKLRDEVKKSVKNVDREQVMNFLLSQPTFTVFKRQTDKFPRRKVRRKSPYQVCSSDLIDMQAFQSFGRGRNYICVVTDIFSNHLFLKGIRQKTTVEMKQCMDEFFASVPTKFKVEYMWTDEGLWSISS